MWGFIHSKDVTLKRRLEGYNGLDSSFGPWTGFRTFQQLGVLLGFAHIGQRQILLLVSKESQLVHTLSIIFTTGKCSFWLPNFVYKEYTTS